MPVVIPNGGGDDITSTEISAYAGGSLADYASGSQTFTEFPTGDRMPQESKVISAVDAKLDAIAQGWIDSGGPGGLQRANSREVLLRSALLQGELISSVRQWSRPGRERALLEMFGVLVKALADRDRQLIELRERLNQSPY